jgi:hypothetical protein
MVLLEASARPRSDYEEELRKSLVREHIIVESARMRGAQAGFRPFENIRKSLYALTEDNLSFLKKMGLVKVTREKLVVTALSKRLISLWRKGHVDSVRRSILFRILSSDYAAYLQFLLNLERIGGSFRLLARGQKRTSTSPLREQLHAAGFKTDIASFYTLRDLFFDLGLVNFVTDKEKEFEIIFLTAKITRSHATTPGFRRRIVVNGYAIHYDKKTSDREFCNRLVDGYKTLTPSWGRWINMLDLRDTVTIGLRISDDDFDELLPKALKKGGCDGFRVDGSAGYRVSGRKYGVVMKSKKMPLMTGDRPIQYVAIARRTHGN